MNRIFSTLATICILSLLGSMRAQLYAQNDDPKTLYEKAWALEEGDQDLEGAEELYRQVTKHPDASRRLVARAMVRSGKCLQDLGRTVEAKLVLEMVLREYDDISDAVKRAKDLLAGNGYSKDASIKAIQKVLREKSVSLDFVDAPLVEVIDFISEIATINFVIDPGVLENADEIQISLRVKELVLEDCLKLILSLKGLTFKVFPGFIVVGHEEAVEAYLAPHGPEALPDDSEMDKAIHDRLDSAKLSIDFMRAAP